MRQILLAGALALACLPLRGLAAAPECAESAALGALDAAVTRAVTAGSAGFQLASGTLAGTLTPEVSFDRATTTWVATSFVNPANDTVSLTEVFTNPNSATTRTVLLPPGATHVRVRVSAYTSGTANAILCVSAAPSPVASRPAAVNRFAAIAAASTATTLTEIVAAPGAGVSLYLTDASLFSSAASTTAADEQLLLKSGTGTNCGTGTATVFACFNPANGGCVANFATPIKLTANNALCWVAAVAGTKHVAVQGFKAP